MQGPVHDTHLPQAARPAPITRAGKPCPEPRFSAGPARLRSAPKAFRWTTGPPVRQHPRLYNGFLAAGLVWSLLADGTTAFQAKVFFLACVLVAGLYGAATASRRILLVQAVPAAIGQALVPAAH
ncbi:DUF1304 domain-containing protein [Plantactinospora solaniradicis]|uniref:DUF1304 domain-containing protein n=1 Tax=Plantactinospora solaniradicis TaxID=1723736 RepID=A0ABW1KHX8_9ACTN